MKNPLRRDPYFYIHQQIDDALKAVRANQRKEADPHPIVKNSLPWPVWLWQYIINLFKGARP